MSLNIFQSGGLPLITYTVCKFRNKQVKPRIWQLSEPTGIHTHVLIKVQTAKAVGTNH